MQWHVSRTVKIPNLTIVQVTLNCRIKLGIERMGSRAKEKVDDMGFRDFELSDKIRNRKNGSRAKEKVDDMGFRDFNCRIKLVIERMGSRAKEKVDDMGFRP